MISALQHDALPFSGPRGFVTAAVTVVEDALSRAAVPVVFAGGDRIAAVRSSLGADGDEVVGLDMAVDGRNPARVLPALQRLVDDHPARELSCVGEPIRAGDSSNVVSEMVLHELLLRLPEFRPWNCLLTCAYDRRALPRDVVSKIEATHRRVPDDPADQVDRVRAEPLPRATRPQRGTRRRSHHAERAAQLHRRTGVDGGSAQRAGR